MARLDGKVAIITGGARGMGAEDARRLVAEGAKVVIGDVLDAEGEAVAAELGAAAVYVHLDVTSEESWAAAVDAAHDAFGPVSVLVNNAGVLSYGAVDTIEKAEFERVAAVNVVGPLLGMKAVAGDMRAAGGGAVVNISSAAGLIPMANLGSYVASKWALRGLTKVAAMDLGHAGIRVNSIHPGGVETPMAAGTSEEMFAGYAIPRIGDVAEIASAVAFLVSDEASFITGAELAVDGGMALGTMAVEG